MKTTDLIAWIGVSTGVIASLIWSIYTKVAANRPKLGVREYVDTEKEIRSRGGELRDNHGW